MCKNVLMEDKWPPRKRATYLRKKFARLNEKRKKMMAHARAKGRTARKRLTGKQRERVLAKTDGRCHICGGKVGARWQADHVLAHSRGGDHAEENYLVAHALCNNYRWHYLPEEFQYIMKLGVWAKYQVEKETAVGEKIAAGFVQHERRRMRRSSRED
jgi:5-methylcytosine-specific restriction endonuclease McrA